MKSFKEFITEITLSQSKNPTKKPPLSKAELDALLNSDAPERKKARKYTSGFIKHLSTKNTDTEISETEKATGDLKKACWKGYTAVGLKKKNGRTVPNCVPVKESDDMLDSILKMGKSLYKAHKKGELKQEIKGWGSAFKSVIKNPEKEVLRPRDYHQIKTASDEFAKKLQKKKLPTVKSDD
jgi:hypothetical protein